MNVTPFSSIPGILQSISAICIWLMLPSTSCTLAYKTLKLTGKTQNPGQHHPYGGSYCDMLTCLCLINSGIIPTKSNAGLIAYNKTSRDAYFKDLGMFGDRRKQIDLLSWLILSFVYKRFKISRDSARIRLETLEGDPIKTFAAHPIPGDSQSGNLSNLISLACAQQSKPSQGLKLYFDTSPWIVSLLTYFFLEDEEEHAFFLSCFHKNCISQKVPLEGFFTSNPSKLSEYYALLDEVMNILDRFPDLTALVQDIHNYDLSMSAVVPSPS